MPKLKNKKQSVRQKGKACLIKISQKTKKVNPNRPDNKTTVIEANFLKKIVQRMLNDLDTELKEINYEELDHWG